MGANRAKGEAEIKVADRAYVLAFNVNAMCEVEYVLDMSTDRILRALQVSPPLHIVRALLWGGLRQHHPEVDLIGAGSLIEEMGGPGLALEGIGQALLSAFPDAKEAAPEDPQKGAPAGTGRRSSKRGLR